MTANFRLPHVRPSLTYQGNLGLFFSGSQCFYKENVAAPLSRLYNIEIK